MEAKQLAMDFPPRNWGGRRPGAGRPRRKTDLRPEVRGAGVPHLEREALTDYLPVHVTLKVRNGVGNLRAHERAKIIERALHAAKTHAGLAVIHWSIQGNHLHLIVEVSGKGGLSHGIQSFAIRVAKGLNKVNRRHGPVFADRYHSEVLRNPTQVKNTIRYVERNVFLHAGLDDRAFPDVLSSDWYAGAPEEWAPQRAPRTWLLRVGWKKMRGSAPPRA